MLTIRLASTKSGIANLRILALAVYGDGAGINTHQLYGKPNFYSVDTGMRHTAGNLAEALRDTLECLYGEVRYVSEYDGSEITFK
jgi:hypothetical protein